jgi:hypothetical protein
LAFRPQPPIFPQGFRQDLTYEQILREQVQVCLGCFNDGDRDGLERALKALFALLTPKVRDAEFREHVEDLDDEWKKKVREKEVARKVELEKSRNGCPDLVPMVQTHPDLNHLGRQLYEVLSLLERRKMGLRAVVEESI